MSASQCNPLTGSKCNLWRYHVRCAYLEACRTAPFSFSFYNGSKFRNVFQGAIK